MIRIELKKAFHNRMLYITLAIAIAIAVFSAVTNIQDYTAMEEMKAGYRYHADIPGNPEHEIISTHNRWIGQDTSSMGTSLFYLLLPLLAALPYSWSYLSEQHSGYVKNVITRNERKPYYLAKYVATFLSGAFIIFVPMLLNLVIVSSVIPAAGPDISYDMYYGLLATDMLTSVFYTKPILFIVLRLIMGSGFAGLIATAVMGLGQFIKKTVAVLILPFLALVGLNYLSSFFAGDNLIELSLINLLHGGGLATTFPVLAIYVFVLVVMGYGFGVLKAARNDVF